MAVIFFNWNAVKRHAKYDPYKVLKVFNEFAKTGVTSNLAGNSFLLNVSGLMQSFSYDSEKLDYIILAASRNYFDYEYQGNSGLWLPLATIDTVKISQNRLLQINDDHVKFKYEELNKWL